jgi:hypothetical protein
VDSNLASEAFEGVRLYEYAWLGCHECFDGFPTLSSPRGAANLRSSSKSPVEDRSHKIGLMAVSDQFFSWRKSF